MAGLSKDILYSIATTILTSVESTFAAHTVDLPDRVYVNHGRPAFDCEQLTISLPMMFRGMAGQEDASSLRTQPCTLVRAATYTLTIVRCVPTSSDDGSPPSVAALEASAEELYVDGWLLSESIREAWSSDAFDCACLDLAMGHLTAVDASGGYAGWTQDFEVTVGPCPGAGS